MSISAELLRVEIHSREPFRRPGHGFGQRTRRIGIFARGKTRNFRIRISPFAARWVQEDPWHPDQSSKREADGSVVITLPAAHDLEIIPRVLALGPEAELLAPVASRRVLAEMLSQMGARYG